MNKYDYHAYKVERPEHDRRAEEQRLADSILAQDRSVRRTVFAFALLAPLAGLLLLIVVALL